ncbi:MAG: hypothetical protein KC448_05745 [Yoonia sp.]|nr:hypothetical protein [Yoonia sp.]
MTNILGIVTSPNIVGSQSRKAAGHVLAGIHGAVTTRDRNGMSLRHRKSTLPMLDSAPPAGLNDA